MSTWYVETISGQPTTEKQKQKQKQKKRENNWSQCANQRSITIEKCRSNMGRKDVEETPKERKSFWDLPLPAI